MSAFGTLVFLAMVGLVSTFSLATGGTAVVAKPVAGKGGAEEGEQGGEDRQNEQFLLHFEFLLLVFWG